MDNATAATGQRHQCARHTPATGAEEKRDNQVYALTTHQLHGEERETRANQVYALHTPATGGE